jgi:hypothetical protein
MIDDTADVQESEAPKRVRLCRNARSNKSFYSNGVASGDSYDCGIIWCAHTNDGMGPDGAVADAEDCVEGRKCYE